MGTLINLDWMEKSVGCYLDDYDLIAKILDTKFFVSWDGVMLRTLTKEEFDVIPCGVFINKYLRVVGNGEKIYRHKETKKLLTVPYFDCPKNEEEK